VRSFRCVLQRLERHFSAHRCALGVDDFLDGLVCVVRVLRQLEAELAFRQRAVEGLLRLQGNTCIFDVCICQGIFRCQVKFVDYR